MCHSELAERTLPTQVIRKAFCILSFFMMNSCSAFFISVWVVFVFVSEVLKKRINVVSIRVRREG